MKFILYDSDDYFPDKVLEDVKRTYLNDKAYIVEGSTEESTVDARIRYRTMNPSDILESYEIVDRVAETVTLTDGREITHHSLILNMIFIEKRYTVEINSLEELDKLSVEYGEPLIIDYDSRGLYEFPSLHVYDNYLE